MADRQRCPDLRGPGFQRHQGDAFLHRAQRHCRKAWHVAQAFDMHADGAHGGVVDQVIDKIFKA